MKLIMCGSCHDVVKLDHESRSCKCGKSSGRYLDHNQAVYSGYAMPIGMRNDDLRLAWFNWIAGKTTDIRTYTFAKDAPTYTYEETKDEHVATQEISTDCAKDET